MQCSSHKLTLSISNYSTSLGFGSIKLAIVYTDDYVSKAKQHLDFQGFEMENIRACHEVLAYI